MKKLFLLAVSVLIMAFAQMATAKEVSWTPALEREDGVAMTIDEIKGYRVYYSDGPNSNYTNVIDVPAPNTSVDVPALPDVDRWVVVTTVDIDGRNSAYSIRGTVVAEPPPPTVIMPPKPPIVHIAPASTDRVEQTQ